MKARPSLVALVCTAAFLGLGGIIAPAFAATTALATAPDKKAPTKPTNLHATGNTAWSVSLAWNASVDNSGQLTYRVVCSNGQSMLVSQTSTSAVFTKGLLHGGTYSFWVHAFDPSGNTSQNSNTVSSTLPLDTTNPSQPVVTLTEVGPTHAILSWSAVDDGPLVYALYKDGVLHHQPSSWTSTTVYLQSQTAYTFTVLARDKAGHWSPTSEPLVVTTPAPNPNDVTPPTQPANLWAQGYGDLEFEANWTQSTDDFTPQKYIRYDLYVNGNWMGGTIASGHVTDYGQPGENLIEVFAVDEAGNESEVASAILFLP
jgi:chitodextrinase